MDARRFGRRGKTGNTRLHPHQELLPGASACATSFTSCPLCLKSATRRYDGCVSGESGVSVGCHVAGIRCLPTQRNKGKRGRAPRRGERSFQDDGWFRGRPRRGCAAGYPIESRDPASWRPREQRMLSARPVDRGTGRRSALGRNTEVTEGCGCCRNRRMRPGSSHPDRHYGALQAPTVAASPQMTGSASSPCMEVATSTPSVSYVQVWPV